MKLHLVSLCFPCLLLSAPTWAADAAEFLSGVVWTIPFNPAPGKDYVYTQEEREKELRQMRSYGIEWVTLPCWGEMRDGQSTQVFLPPRSPTDPGGFRRAWIQKREREEIIRTAHRLRMKVYLMPAFIPTHPKINLGGFEKSVTWRGVIEPVDWEAWFESYGVFIRFWAEFAQKEGVEMFCVGTELRSAEPYTEQWRRTIRKVRQVYKGPIAYAADWSSFDKPQFYDQVDVIGISAYFPLITRPASQPPRLEDLVNSWRNIQKRVLRLKAEYGKPLIFNEIGYNAVEGVSRIPGNYKIWGRKPSLPEQTLCYRAFVQAWKDTPELDGTFIWSWGKGNKDGSWPDDAAYGFAGRPAGDLIRDFFLHRKKSGPPNNIK